MGNSGCQTWHEINFKFFQQTTIRLEKFKAHFTKGSVLYELKVMFMRKSCRQLSLKLLYIIVFGLIS